MVKTGSYWESLRIPKAFKLFATTVKVMFDNDRMNDTNKYGEADYSTQQITLSHTIGVRPLCEGRIMDCFYHEKVHLILDAMKEDVLSQNEKFVDVFAKLLRQSDETAVFGDVGNEVLSDGLDKDRVINATCGPIKIGSDDSKDSILEIINIRPGSSGGQSNFLYGDLVGFATRNCGAIDFFLSAYATRSHMISNYADVLRQYIDFNNKLINK